MITLSKCVKKVAEKFIQENVIKNFKSNNIYEYIEKTNMYKSSQLSHCLLVWISHTRANNSKINRLHESCFSIIYSDKQSSYEM